MRRWLLWVPLALFLVVLGVAVNGLVAPSDPAVRSALVGQTLPRFTLPPIARGKPGLSSADFGKGEPRLLNIFASWCLPCAAEAPQLLALRDAGVTIDAIAVRDRAEDIDRFLGRYGDPYAGIGSDPTSSVQLALGSSGVPETFVIDGEGRIVMQHIGDIRPEDVRTILAAVERAR